MNKSFFTCLVAGFSMLLGTQSKATMFTDLDTINQQLTAGSSLGSFYQGEFNIVTDGFRPGIDIVSTATITFSLTDITAATAGEFTIDLGDIIHDSQYTSFHVMGPEQVSVDLLANLNEDGILSYKVTATSGAFCLESAQLSAVSVPDTGSTLALGGLTLVFLLAARWRVFKRC